MRLPSRTAGIGISSLAALLFLVAWHLDPSAPGALGAAGSASVRDHGDRVLEDAGNMLRDGRHTFRFDTFGDEVYWGGTLRLHEAIAGAANGGVGPGLSPVEALAAGLKVDQDALTPALQNQIAQPCRLNDPAVTLAPCASMPSSGHRSRRDDSIVHGIQCALCH
jgi:hypothetical protein